MMYHPLISLLFFNKYCNNTPRSFRCTVVFARLLGLLVICGLFAYNLKDFDLTQTLIVLIIIAIAEKLVDYKLSYKIMKNAIDYDSSCLSGFY